MIKITTIPNTYENIREELPLIIDSNSLANLLDLTNSQLWGLVKAATSVPAGNKGSLYKKFVIPKRSGGNRELYAPQGALKGVQTKIRDRILDLAPKSKVSVAYRKGVCPGDTAKKIAGAKVILKLDIKDYFPSIKYRYVKDYLSSLGYPDEVSDILSGILCVKAKNYKFVCQGGTASPMLANRIAERLIDPKVVECLPEGWQYVRYCDNLYVWPSKGVDPTEAGPHRELLSNIRGAIYSAGFSSHKGSIVPYYKRQSLLGLTVNEKANMPKFKYKALRACLFNCSKKGFKSQLGKAHMLGFQSIGDDSDLLRFKLFLQGLINYYKDYVTLNKSNQFISWYKEALDLENNS
tara:strand:+ start:1645 stop:2697 length:1053 start_codon:yes stop_codon:yes gene_type:complete